MSDFTITAGSDSDRHGLVLDPFYPNINKTGSAGNVGYSIKFNQGYVFDYLGYAGLASPLAIGGMDDDYVVLDGESKSFGVELIIDSGDHSIVSATFKEYVGGVSPNDPPPIELTSPTGNYTRNIAVCSMLGGDPVNFNLRDNIQWWGLKIEQKGVNSGVGYPIIDPNGARPLSVRSISGVSGDYTAANVSVYNSGETVAIDVNLPTGSGVMYGALGEYQFLPYPTGASVSNVYVLACNDPNGPPYWLGTTGC